MDGSLATEPRGTSGFGYDPIFIPGTDSGQRTYAQMASEEKNKISHRSRAVEAMRNAWGSDDPSWQAGEARNPYCPRRSRTGRPGADPCGPFPPHPTVGPSWAHTAPVRARPFPVPGIIADPGHPARLWPPSPRLAGHANVRRHAAVGSAESRSLALKRAQTECPADLPLRAKTASGTTARGTPRRRLAHPWRVTCVPGSQHQRRITTRVPITSGPHAA